MTRIGIDLGTTTSLAALADEHGPHVIPRGAGLVLPSAVAFDGPPERQPPLLGLPADRHRHAVRAIKRLLGRTWDEAYCEGAPLWFPPGGETVRLARRGPGVGVEVRFDGRARFFPPQEIAALLLRHLREQASLHLGQPVESAVIAVPACFHGGHRQATLDAARLAGLEVADGDLLDEPTATALAFSAAAAFEPGETVLVADWGGGKLDATVLRCDGHGWQQLAIEGHVSLGGDNADLALLLHVLEKAGRKIDLMAHAGNTWRLRREARRVKELLSEAAEADFVCPQLEAGDGPAPPPLSLSVTRADLDALLAPLLEQVEDVLERSLGQRGVDRDRVGQVLLVGGSSRIPAFRALVSRLLPRAVLREDVDPLCSVGLGAAIHARLHPPLARLSPFAYFVRDEDGHDQPLIPAGSAAPSPDTARFMFAARTRYPGQTVFRVTLVERLPLNEGPFRLSDIDRLDDDGRPVRLFARGLPATPGDTRVDVEVWLDGHRRLQAACHVDGLPHPFPLTEREEGLDDMSLRQALLLDCEALVEANPDESEGLLARLSSVLPVARAGLATREREAVRRSSALLADLREQIRARRRQQVDAVRVGDAGRLDLMRRVSFYEERVLPDFWDVIPPGPRSVAVDAIRAIRVLEQTGGPYHLARQRCNQLEQTLDGCSVGLAVRALRLSETTGVPERLSSALREAATRMRLARRRSDTPAYERESRACREMLDEAQRAWGVFCETGVFLDVRPDLVLGAPAGGGWGN